MSSNQTQTVLYMGHCGFSWVHFTLAPVESYVTVEGTVRCHTDTPQFNKLCYHERKQILEQPPISKKDCSTFETFKRHLKQWIETN